MKRILLVLFLMVSLNVWALVDPNATPETKALYARLQATSGKQILIGGCGFYRSDHAEYGTPPHDITGKWPVVLALSFANTRTVESDRYNMNGDVLINNSIYTQLAKQHYQRGGILIVSCGFKNFSTGGNTKDLTGTPVASILPGGDKRTEYLAFLDTFADWCKSFNDYNGNLIPFIFRPYHEADGGWYYWGIDSCTNAQYVALWRDLVSYLRDIKGVHNILYGFCAMVYREDCFSGNRYPGDDYVDIFGGDFYTNGLYTIPHWSPDTGNNGPSIMDRIHFTANAARLAGKPWGQFEGSWDLTVEYRDDYWTWVMDQVLSDDLGKTASFWSFWESPNWGPINSRGDANDYKKLSTDYPNIGWLNDINTVITGGATISGANIQ